MKGLSGMALGLAAILIAGIVLLMAGPPNGRPPARVADVTSPLPDPASISAGGVRLVSAGITLPDDVSPAADAPGADVFERNCTSCHSASMVRAQPVLTAAQWQATITKMREAYGAQVADRDVPVILAYLLARQAPQQAQPATRP